MQGVDNILRSLMIVSQDIDSGLAKKEGRLTAAKAAQRRLYKEYTKGIKP